MKQITNDQIDEIEELIKLAKNDFDECIESKSIAIENWQKYSELYYEYLGKDNDWRYCIKRGFHLWWVNVKVNITVFLSRIPLRG